MYILVPESKKGRFYGGPTQMERLPEKQVFTLVVVPDKIYKVADKLIKSGELNKLLEQDPEALLHRLRLGGNAIEIKPTNNYSEPGLVSLVDLELSVRTTNTLEASGVSTISDLIDLVDHGAFFDIGLGETGLKEIERKLTERGYAWTASRIRSRT